MPMFGNVHIAYSIALVVSFVLFYFMINYKMSNLIDEKFAKQEKRTAKKAASLYRKYGIGKREKAEQHRVRMIHERDEQEGVENRGRYQQDEDGDEDSVKNVGGFNSAVNHASFDEESTE
jgi:hypothetical protein